MKRWLSEAPLGEKSVAPGVYSPDILFPIPRRVGREELGITDSSLFSGVDVWTAYELSWLLPSGKPQIAIGEIVIPCSSPNLVESKSLKLYFHSLNQVIFTDPSDFSACVCRDISRVVGAEVSLRLYTPEEFSQLSCCEFEGDSLDGEVVEMDTFLLKPDALWVSSNHVSERLYTHLFRSNCPKTGQPDWGSVHIHYHGRQIDRQGLLRYLLSFRQQNEFHEQCVERIFVDIMRHCSPEKLTVYARYLRRGGIDINPFRSNWQEPSSLVRLFRQ